MAGSHWQRDGYVHARGPFTTTLAANFTCWAITPHHRRAGGIWALVLLTYHSRSFALVQVGLVYLPVLAA